MDARPIYLDNGATSWPKAPGVGEAMADFLAAGAANPGRSAHRLSREMARRVFHLRERLIRFFGGTNSDRVTFALNVTHALNQAFHGLLRPGDHVLVSPLEHNAVMRPLRSLEETGRIEVELLPADRIGRVSPRDVKAALRPRTRLVVVQHGSNVSGTLQDIPALAGAKGHALLVVDAAQTAGHHALSLSDGADVIAWTGHKGLLGPTGVGGLVLGDAAEPLAWIRGGTGSRSEEELQPDELPDRLEAGTQNTVGLVGLAAALDWMEERGVAALRRESIARTERLLGGLASIEGLALQGPPAAEDRCEIVSILLPPWTAAELAFALDRRWGIASRPGLHCAPAAHRHFGSFPEGSLRLSSGPFTTQDELDATVAAVRELAAEGKARGR